MLHLFRRNPRVVFPVTSPSGLSDWSIRKKLLVFLIPPVILTLGATGFVLNLFSNRYIDLALGRSSLTMTLAQAHEIEIVLEGCREDIVALAHRPMTRERLRNFMDASASARGELYAEAAYVGEGADNQYAFLTNGERVEEVPAEYVQQAKNSPFVVSRKAVGLGRGQVALSELLDVYYPPTGFGTQPRQRDLTVLRLTTPVLEEHGRLAGYLILSIDARQLRNVLSLYNSPRSPLLGFNRTAENRLSLFLDERGWFLFQSENVDDPQRQLSVESAKVGLSGDHGKPGYDGAFRPGPRHETFWRMISAMQQGLSGIERGEADFGPSKIASSEDYIGYAPVRFRGGDAEGSEIIGGIVYIDRSLLPRAAEFGQFNILFVTTLGAIVTMAGCIILLARVITKPILRLAEEVRSMRLEGRLHEIELPDSDLDTSTLKRAINRLVAALLSKEMEIKVRDERLRSVRARERVQLVTPLSRQGLPSEALEDLVGESSAMNRLLERIQKISATDADVLIIGETGTGKELTAEAVHRLSRRKDMPFISINCGALDENLLMDALFGHIKGAFSEAKSDRKGAFLAADGGTLLLDEIGNASPRVQQALLRALSVRRISPLGSDEEQAFDARVIAATNVNLKDLVASGTFREDLFYRLQVLAVSTPSLRERQDDIPVLAGYFLKLATRRMGKGELSLSRGALDKLLQHGWPGNVRELKNCIIRAAALAERELILAEDIHFEDETPGETAVGGQPQAGGPGESEPQALDAPLSARQRKALRSLLDRPTFSRQDYQDSVGNDVPQRTAQHDLRDLVARGIVLKEGKGPATRYRLVGRRMS
ncbi:sigma 54-interacting transcriptional regulator [Desulfovibrio sp. TomC]|uniref:sigma 54-interacting transcriptional regulator n=1 Tax=Desulfovibrio sp. TomC TaxID=1562888 RepID=UPI0005738063|nr:sigma 54-interacting transcriptional regulator [Desulfovibrio sp. TomC]KHK02338.1 Response regulator of zinc sigma-54-dependent two-component system [Desulfovibrio sp. TomC]